MESRVIFRSDELRRAGVTEEQVDDLLRSLSAQVVRQDGVLCDRFIVVDYADYGPAIREVLGEDGHATHTENEHVVGIGKTVRSRGSDGVVHNTIIVRSGVVGAALGIEGVQPTKSEFFGKYIIRHELGHCLDHLLRTSPPEAGWTGEFDIPKMSGYYQHMLMCEFAACAFAAHSISDEEFRYLADLDHQSTGTMLEELVHARSVYAGESMEEFVRFATQAGQSIWFCLVQHAKVVGHLIGSERKSASVPFPGVLSENAERIAILQRLCDLLCQMFRQYPQWPDDGWTEVDQAWRDLGLTFGLRLEHSEAGSALWLEQLGDEQER